ncbi:MAG: aromatic amino acid transport family protein [bacterium]|nr:aromatic amino acid transport family protein [bacterium]
MENLKNKPFLHATAILIGTMVGVGIFGIPFAFAKAGFWIGFLFLIGVGSATLFLNFIYGEIILRTHQPHQMVGYTQLYLGNFWKRLIFFSFLLTTYAALLAYIIIAGEFLPNVLSSVFYSSSNSFSLWFFGIASLLVLFGIRTLAWVELTLSILFIAVIALIFGFGVGDVNFSNYSYVNFEFWFFPYGVLLFAFGGLPAIPIQRQILVNNERYFKKSILTALSVVGVLYFVFGWTVLGISGDATTPDAISGLIDQIGGRVVFLGSLFGVMAVSTSYLMLGTAMLEIFHLDYGMGRKVSWLLVVAPPLVLFLGGLRNFIDVIGLAGAVGIGLEAFVLIFMYIKAKSHGDRIPEYSLKIPAWALYLLALIFVGGVGYTLFTR